MSDLFREEVTRCVPRTLSVDRIAAGRGATPNAPEHPVPTLHTFEFRWVVAQDFARESPLGMEALRQTQLPLRQRDLARPLLVPPLARGR